MVARQRILHDKHGRLNIHNVVADNVVKEPIEKEREAERGEVVRRLAGLEQPANHGPARDNVRAEHGVCRVINAADEAHEVGQK